MQGNHKFVNKLAYLLTVVFVVLITFLFNHYADADFISIAIKTKTTVVNDKLKVDIKLTNRGDESAFDVVVSVDLNGDQKAGVINDQLGVNKSFQSEFDYDLKLDKPGKYPLIVIINYADANSYPFSALSVSQFSYKDDVSPGIMCKSKNIEITKRGEMNLSVKNLDENVKEVKSRLLLSKELTIPKATKNITLLPRSEKNVKFDIINSSALSGSNYPGFVIFEYDEKNKHFSYVSSASVKIGMEEDLVPKYKWVIIVIISILFVLFIVLQFVNKRSS